MTDLLEYLQGNRYPGRGIVIGRKDEKHMRIYYFIMGRSVNSRNRVFAYTEDGIRTEACDPAKLQDPSLVIYHPVRVFKHSFIVTNGDQTDTIRDYLAKGRSFRDALMTRSFEPDGPLYTPRISGIIRTGGRFELSILKSGDGDPDYNHRFFYTYDDVPIGSGCFISTYQCDGNPPPSFAGEPIAVTLPEPDDVWSALNPDNKVSLYTCTLDIGNFECDERLFNLYGGENA